MSRLILAGAALLVSLAAMAQQPQPGQGDTEELRRGTAEGVATCKANLTSAPADLKLSEVEDFCGCMGVNEFVMAKGAMSDADKAVIRPRQQQMCLASIRKDSAPAQATAPTQPVPAPAPPAAVSAPVETPSATTPPALPQPAPVASGNPYFGLWAENQQICREASTNEIPDVDGFVFIGEKTVYDRHTRCRITGITGRGQEKTYNQSCYGEGEVSKFALKSNYALLGTNGLQFTLKGGQKVNLTLCTRETPAWVREVGRSLFKVVETQGSAAPSPTAPAAPRPKPPAAALGEAECRALLQRTGTAVLPRMQQLVAALNNITSQPQLCQAARKTIAFHSDLKNRLAVCSSRGFVRQTIGNSNNAIANARSQMRQSGC